MKPIPIKQIPVLTLLLITAALIACGGQTDDSSSDADTSAPASASDSLVITLVGEDSVSVLQLLQRDHEVDLKSSVMGVFVTAIDSLETAPSVFWVYTVNDTSPKVACDRMLTRDGDMVRWHFRKSSP